MRYMPTLRSPVSGSLVTTQGSVMKRPPSSGQHFWMGRFNKVEGRRLKVEGSETLGALGQTSTFSLLTSNFSMTPLHGSSLTSFGFAWRKSIAVLNNFSASRNE